MTLTDLDKGQIRLYLSEIKNATEFNDKDYWRAVLQDVDNMPRDLKMKMIFNLCEYWETE